MAFNGSEGGQIPLEKAAELTRNFRKKASKQQVKAHYFGRDIINKILAQDGVVGIRMYYGLEDDDTPQLVLVGVDKDENDLVNGIIADLSYACPPNCTRDNALSSM